MLRRFAKRVVAVIEAERDLAGSATGIGGAGRRARILPALGVALEALNAVDVVAALGPARCLRITMCLPRMASEAEACHSSV